MATTLASTRSFILVGDDRFGRYRVKQNSSSNSLKRFGKKIISLSLDPAGDSPANLVDTGRLLEASQNAGSVATLRAREVLIRAR
jgi:hypothetical protein